MKTLPPVLLVLAATISGCGNEEKDPGDLNDADVARLHIDDVDGAHVHIYATEEVAGQGTAIHLENMTQGPEVDVVAGDDGELDVSMGGAIDHVYALQSRGARVLPVVRRADGTLVRGYGVGFASATGCELQGWNGIIRDAAGDARTACSAGASIVAEGESLEGPVEAFVLRGNTQMTILASLVGVAGEPARFELDFVDGNDDVYTIPVLAQGTPGQFSPTLVQIGQISPDLPGRTVERMGLRAPAGSTLVVADITFIDVAPPEE